MPRDDLPETLEFRRRMDGLTYRFRLAGARNGEATWKREDVDLWLVKDDRLGWIVVDGEKAVLSLLWALPTGEQGELPSEGEWVSKKGDKSYLYDLVFKDTTSL